MIGQNVGHYRITEKLGSGGMGVVYRAVDTRLERDVALKFLPPDLTRDESAKARFMQEAQTASSIDHRNICTIHDIDETDDGRLYICMACYEGRTLASRLEDGPLPVLDAVRIAAGVARGLAVAHERGIIHRDIKPSNIFLTRDGGIRILDFGLAKLASQERLTRPGMTVGTAAYMSPEQAGGCVDHRTDIWSLGVTLYELLTGTTPFKGDTPQALIHSILENDPPPLHMLAEGVPKEVESLVSGCLEKDPDHRPRSANELADELDRIAAGLASSAGAPTRTMRARRPGGRLWLAVFAVALISALALHPAVRRALTGTGGGRALPTSRVVSILPLGGTGGAAGVEQLRLGLLSYLGLRLHGAEQHEEGLVILPVSDAVSRGVTSPADARERSGATLALTGSLDRRGDVIHGELLLIDTADGATIEAREFEERVGNVAVLEDTLAASVLRMLDVSKGPGMPELPGGTTVPAAFESYIGGLGLMLADRDDADGDAAIRLFERAVAADPAFALAYAALGEARWRRCRDTAEFAGSGPAREACQHATQLAPGLAQPHVTLGHIHLQADRVEQAASAFRSALEADPISLEARRGLVAALEAVGDDDIAEDLLRQGAAQSPDDWRRRYDLGVFLAMHGRCAEAVDELRAVVASAPRHESAHSALGAMYYYLERWEEAHEALSRSIEISPDYSAYSNLATLCFQEGRYADAAEMYERALAMDDSDYRVWGNAAAAYLWLPGQKERAMELYRRAADSALKVVAASPHDAHVQSHLASYYGELGERGPALARVDAALQLAPEDPEVLFHVGHTYEVLGERDTALEWIGRAIELGYSRAQIERTPGLRALCADERYLRLIGQHEDLEVL